MLTTNFATLAVFVVIASNGVQAFPQSSDGDALTSAQSGTSSVQPTESSSAVHEGGGILGGILSSLLHPGNDGGPRGSHPHYHTSSDGEPTESFDSFTPLPTTTGSSDSLPPTDSSSTTLSISANPSSTSSGGTLTLSTTDSSTESIPFTTMATRAMGSVVLRRGDYHPHGLVRRQDNDASSITSSTDSSSVTSVPSSTNSFQSTESLSSSSHAGGILGSIISSLLHPSGGIDHPHHRTSSGEQSITSSSTDFTLPTVTDTSTDSLFTSRGEHPHGFMKREDTDSSAAQSTSSTSPPSSTTSVQPTESSSSNHNGGILGSIISSLLHPSGGIGGPFHHTSSGQLSTIPDSFLPLPTISIGSSESLSLTDSISSTDSFESTETDSNSSPSITSTSPMPTNTFTDSPITARAEHPHGALKRQTTDTSSTSSQTTDNDSSTADGGSTVTITAPGSLSVETITVTITRPESTSRVTAAVTSTLTRTLTSLLTVTTTRTSTVFSTVGEEIVSGNRARSLATVV